MSARMITLIDNYDSFTWNLVYYFEELGERVVVHRNDEIAVADVMAAKPEAIVISPGPCGPDQAGISLELIRAASGRVPLLGVCLGHQAVARVFGARIVRAPLPVHGKTSRIRHDGEGVFAGLPDGFQATRYHSLTVEHETFPPSLKITAETEDGVIMGLAHVREPVFGVQFHPESVASEHGHALLANFLQLARARRAEAA